MFPYWILFLSFAAGALGNATHAQPYRPRLMLWVAATFAAVMIGLRYYVGSDWGAYFRKYRQIESLDLFSTLTLPKGDPGYSALNWLSAQVGLEIWFVNLVCGAILITGIYFIARRQPYPWLVFVVAVPYLIIVVGMGYTRQAAAIGFFLIALTFLFEGRIKQFLFMMFLAVTFHQSAIVLLPVIGLALSRNRMANLVLVGALSYMLYHYLVMGDVDEMSRNYIGAQMDSSGAAVRLAMTALPSVLFLLFARSFGFADQERAVWRVLSLAALVAVVAVLMVPSSTVVDRLALYLIPIQLVVLGRVPMVFGGTRNGVLLLVLLIVLYSAAIQFVWLNYAVNADGWQHYRVYPLFS